MKAFAAVIAGVMFIGGGAAYAQEPVEKNPASGYFSDSACHATAKLDRAVKAYILGLETGNEGVAESAAAHLAWMRLNVKERDFNDVKEVLEDIAVNGKGPAIRYRAYLATVVFDSPELFTGVTRTTYANADELFAAISGQLQKTLFGYGNHQ